MSVWGIFRLRQSSCCSVFWWDDNGFHHFCQTWRELQLLCAFEFVPGDWISWNPQAFGGFRWMQTLTSSEKVYLGTDLVDVVYFFWFSFILPSHCLQAWREIPSPFHTERLQSWKPEGTCWPHIKLGKDWGNYRLKSHIREVWFKVKYFRFSLCAAVAIQERFPLPTKRQECSSLPSPSTHYLSSHLEGPVWAEPSLATGKPARTRPGSEGLALGGGRHL